jgi:GxxExxY protein
VGRPAVCTNLAAVLLDDRRLNQLTGKILESAIEVHRHLGAGLFESTYHPCLRLELAERGLQFVAQQTVPLTYKATRVDAAYRLDLVEILMPLHSSQLLTYLRLAELPVGLLINFKRSEADGRCEAPYQ